MSLSDQISLLYHKSGISASLIAEPGRAVCSNLGLILKKIKSVTIDSYIDVVQDNVRRVEIFFQSVFRNLS
jgi:hypothetical protein